MKVAVYANENGEAVGFYEPGRVYVYSRIAGTWVEMGRLPFALRHDMNLAETRTAITGLAEKLGEECRRFIVGELRGVPCALLDSLGFRIWHGAGPVDRQLEEIAVEEERPGSEAACGCAQGCGLVAAGDPAGEYYQLDLKRILAEDSGLNSRAVLIPILEEGAFRKLEVRCDHVPRWMGDGGLAVFGLRIEDEREDGDAVRVTIVRGEGAGVARRIARGAGCGGRRGGCGCGG